MGRIKAGGKVFRDPIHELIRIAPGDDFLVDLIDTREFQRLRRIRQLGVSGLTYHGAEHTRFVHSLGVLNFTLRIMESLERRYGADSQITTTLKSNGPVLKAAALLHDVGHGPFSHLLERAFGKLGHHEKVTASIVRSEHTGVGRTLRAEGIDPEVVASIIEKAFAPKFIVDIVSSQLDADRMDYLLRDSHHTGVSYGRYDVEWLLHSMCVARVKGLNDPKHDKLCLDKSKGLFAAERFVMARLEMYQQVYFHRVTRGYEVLLLRLFEAAATAIDAGGLPAGTPAIVEKYFRMRGELSIEEVIKLDESQMLAAFHAWADSVDEQWSTIRKLAGAFLNRIRLYKTVNVSDLAAPELMKLERLLSKAPLNPDGVTPTYGIDSIQDTPYKGVLYRGRKQKSPEEMINESILVTDARKDSPAEPIEVYSPLLRSLDDSHFDTTRLYYDRDHEQAYAPILAALKLAPQGG
jgi:HD superfamily phosphohydrolase